MRTPDEVARTMAKWACPDEDGPCSLCVQDYADLIRARDAEVRADEREKVLAEVRRRNATAVPSRAFVSPYDAEP